jgi:diguanylate cyclase (GGDEF)-like protein
MQQNDDDGANMTARSDDASMFELAPISLWLQDLSAVKALFGDWRRAGVVRLHDFLLDDPERARACWENSAIIKVNQRTLSLYEATDQQHLIDNLPRIFREDTFHAYVEELAQLWEGKTRFSSRTVNYTLSGRRIDIELDGIVLPGHEHDWQRVLIAISDVTARESARRAQALSEQYARGLFEHSPVSLWVEDFTGIKRLLDDIRSRGITDLRTFTDVHPEFVPRCMSEIHVIDVNRHTLSTFGAPDKQTLLNRLGDVFRDNMQPHFREQLIDLWQGKLFQQREVVNYALDGNEIHFHLQFSVLPGHEHDWSLVQVALTDITARKKAEAYLEYLGQHHVLTKLYNRSFYVDELNRLERKGPLPVTIVIADLNGLKAANDQWGHAAGDALLRRAGEVLNEVVRKPHHAARIGGDEFAILMCAADERDGEAMIENINRLVEVNNQFYSGLVLGLSMGMATSRPSERLEAVARRADVQMFKAKRDFYSVVEHDRPQSSADA